MRVSTASRSRGEPRRPRIRSTTTSGAAPRRDGPIEDLNEPPRRRRLPARHPARAGAGRARAAAGRLRGAAAPSRWTASSWIWSSCSSARPSSGQRHGVGIVDHIEDRIVGLKVRDLYEVPAAAIVLDRAPRAGEARLHDPSEQLQGHPGEPLGLPLLRGAVARAASRRPRRLHGLGQRVRHRRGDREAVPWLGDARGPHLALRAV